MTDPTSEALAAYCKDKPNAGTCQEIGDTVKVPRQRQLNPLTAAESSQMLIAAFGGPMPEFMKESYDLVVIRNQEDLDRYSELSK